MMKIAKKMSRKHINVKKQNPIAMLPIAVFLVLYLGLGILFEYIMKIPMGFYNVPIIIAFLVAILVACLQNRSAVSYTHLDVYKRQIYICMLACKEICEHLTTQHKSRIVAV